MSTLSEIRGGLGRVWDSVAEGWRHLMTRASGAITRFRPTRQEEEGGWGVLAADVYEDDDKIVVSLEAPGMEQDDFDVTIDLDVLVVRGEKRYQNQRREGGYRIAECAYGAFERAIPLPETVDASRARAKYRKGVLRIELPKAGSGRRRISIAG